MGEEVLPTIVAPEGFEAQEGLVPVGTPKLAGSFEAALILAAGGLDGSTANGLNAPLTLPVVHPVLMFLQIRHFLGDLLAGFGAARLLSQDAFQTFHDPHGGAPLQLPQRRCKPALQPDPRFASVGRGSMPPAAGGA